jgi:hypothetical protein
VQFRPFFLCFWLRRRPEINEVIVMLHKPSSAFPTALSEKAVDEISQALKLLLSDVFALYLKTKNFHWHMSVRISATITCFSMSKPTRFLP